MKEPLTEEETRKAMEKLFQKVLGKPWYECGKCGNRVEETDRFCSVCGAKLFGKDSRKVVID